MWIWIHIYILNTLFAFCEIFMFIAAFSKRGYSKVFATARAIKYNSKIHLKNLNPPWKLSKIQCKQNGPLLRDSSHETYANKFSATTFPTFGQSFLSFCFPMYRFCWKVRDSLYIGGDFHANGQNVIRKEIRCIFLFCELKILHLKRLNERCKWI